MPTHLFADDALASLATTVLAVLAVGILSLFVHDLALTHLKVPYPHEGQIPTIFRAAELFLVLAGMVWFSRLALLRLAGLSPMVAAAFTAVLVAGLYEFLRIIIITTTLAKNGWSGAYYVFSIAIYGPKIAAEAALAFCVALIVRRTGRLHNLLAATFILGVFAEFVLLTGANRLSAWLADDLASFDAENRYNPPYPAGIYAVIYATYTEPTLAAFVMTGLAWPGLRGGLFRRAVTFCFVLLLIHGRIGQFLIESSWVKVASVPLRFAATGQFLLETTVLGLACPVLWHLLVAGNQPPRA